MWKIPGGDCKTFQSSACQATSGKVLPDGKTHWKESLLFISTSKRIRNILFSFPGKRAAVGYQDGTVRLWDLKQGIAVHVIKGESLTCFILLHMCFNRNITQREILVPVKQRYDTIKQATKNKCIFFGRSGRTQGGADLPRMQQGRLSAADGVSGRLRQAHQHRYRQGGCHDDAAG